MRMISRHQVLTLASVLLLGLGVAHGQDQDPAMQNMATGDPSQDPPQRVARISVLQGTASFEPASVNDFSPAEINYPMTTGDRLYAAQGSTAEIQTGQIAVRLGQTTDLTVTAMTDTLAQFGLAAGSVRLREYAIEPGTTVELDTPNVAITVTQPGDIRVDVDPTDDVSYLTVSSGEVQVDGTEFQQTFGPGTRIRLDGLNPLETSAFEEQRADALDVFASGRDQQMEAGLQGDGEYLNAGTVGGADLGSYGDWQQDADNGAVWFPRGVGVDWEPYRVGHWAWIAPWGWTWVEAEPWGFAPFHYGRWARFGPRWGWVPGPRVVRPVWAPALVVFVGGNDFAAGLGYRDGVTGWFPLGPREVYQPWYHSSPRYLNRVNVSNLWDRDQRDVRRIYDQRTVDVRFGAGGDGHGGYAYRDHAVVMPQSAFAAGRPAAQNQVRVRPGDLQKASFLQHPPVSPTHEMVSPAPPRAVPTHQMRPVLDAKDRAQDGEQGGGYAAPIQRQGPVAGNVYTGGSGNSQQPRNGNGQQPSPGAPVRGDYPTSAPGSGVGSTAFHGRPVQSNGTGTDVSAAPPNGGNRNGSGTMNPGGAGSGGRNASGNGVTIGTGAGTEPVQTSRPGPPRTTSVPGVVAPVQSTMAPIRSPQQADPQQQGGGRSLFNRAQPPEPRPNFDQQRQAIEQTEPGRPLNPQQMENVRRNQPVVQQPQAPPQQSQPQREARPQPQPQQRPQPTPAAPANRPQPQPDSHRPGDRN